MADETTTTSTRTSSEGGGAQRTAKKTTSSSASAKKPASNAGKKPAASSASAKKTAEPSSGTETASRSKGSQEGSGPRMNTAKAAREAMNQLEELTNRDAEGIVGIEKNDDGGWTVTVEVVESRRIPNTADVLAEYTVTVDTDGDLTAYSRQSRYVRGRATRGE